MNKFTKSMVAIAVSALVAGPAFGDADYSGSKAQVKLSGSGCKAEGEKNLDINISLEFPTEAGPNTGLWFSQLFSFGQEISGEGFFIISKPGSSVEDAPKMTTNDVSWSVFDAMEGVMSDYSDGCKNAVGYNGDTLIKKFDTKISKDGEKAKVQMQAEGTYENDKGKSKKVKLKINSGTMDMVNFL